MRKAFLGLLIVISLAAGNTTAWARQNGKPIIGFLAFEQGGCKNEPFLRGMRELGYEDGKSVTYECRHSQGRYDLLETAVAELLTAKPDVLVLFGHAPGQAAQRATKTVPIVMSASGEPVSMGFVQSLARPGGNITGVSYYAPELTLKRLELLKSMVPDLKRLAVLMHSGLPEDLGSAYLRDCEAAGKTLGFTVHVVRYSRLEDIDQAFAEMKRLDTQGVFVAPTREVKAETDRVAQLGLQQQLPIIHSRKTFVPAGGLMAYGPDYGALYHRAAFYVDRILKGAKPAELPIEQPARIELHLNMATARKLGLTVPESLLLRADKVIE